MPKLAQKEITTTTKIVTSEDGTETFSITRSIPKMEGEHAYLYCSTQPETPKIVS